eukprot:Hpha_TRINITY_DN31070_c0_g1::TRINITY_DN31070_c0_g1_i1::g.63916::m.63916
MVGGQWRCVVLFCAAALLPVVSGQGAPTVTPRQVETGVEVSIAAVAAVYYTTDGSDPRDASNAARRRYLAPFLISTPGVSNVVAVAISGLSVGTLTRVDVTVPLLPPVISPKGGGVFVGYAEVSLVSPPGVAAYYALSERELVAASEVRATGFRPPDTGIARLPPSDSPIVLTAAAEYEGRLSEPVSSAPFTIRAAAVKPLVIPTGAGPLSLELERTVPSGNSLTITPECTGVSFSPPAVTVGAGGVAVAPIESLSAGFTPGCLNLRLSGTAAMYYAYASSAGDQGVVVPVTPVVGSTDVGVRLASSIGSVVARDLRTAVVRRLNISETQARVLGVVDAEETCRMSGGGALAVFRFAGEAPAGSGRSAAQAFVDAASGEGDILRGSLNMREGTLPFTVSGDGRLCPGDTGSNGSDGVPIYVVIILAVLLALFAAALLFLVILYWSQYRIDTVRAGYDPAPPQDSQEPVAPQHTIHRSRAGPSTRYPPTQETDWYNPDTWAAGCPPTSGSAHQPSHSASGYPPVSAYPSVSGHPKYEQEMVNPVAAAFPHPSQSYPKLPPEPSG